MTSNSPKIEDALRAAILSHPDAVLDDAAVMRALIAANDKMMGSNVVDLRGIAMERLENRLDLLEDTHRSVIAAAYENLAGTNQVHRAILRMLDPEDFCTFIADLNGPVAEILRIDALRLVLETNHDMVETQAAGLADTLLIRPAGFVNSYLSQGRGGPTKGAVLRQMTSAPGDLYGARAAQLGSEAGLLLNLGPDRLPAMLLMASSDPQTFDPRQGADLLIFFAGVFERTLRRFLA
jgi:uncharacterized protein YigA (DUF484 family)